MMRLRWNFNRAVRGRCAGGTALLAGTAAIPTKLEVDDPGYLKTLRTVEQGYEDRASLSPSDRLRLMFLTDEDGQFGPELSFIQAVFGMSWFCGSLVGGFAYGTEAFKLFKAENKQTMFENPRDAQQAMREVLVRSMAKGAVKTGVRLAVVSGFYATVATMSTVYRNKVSPLDHMLAGTVLGGCYQAKAGPKAMVGGAAAGCALGLVGGVATSLVQWASGETVEERWRREFQYQRLKKTLSDSAVKPELSDEIVEKEPLKMPADKTTESIEERSFFVSSYFAVRRLLGMDKEILEYDYSVLSKPKE